MTPSHSFRIRARPSLWPSERGVAYSRHPSLEPRAHRGADRVVDLDQLCWHWPETVLPSWLLSRSPGEEPVSEGAFAGIIFRALHGPGHAAEDFLDDVWGGIAVGASAERESRNEWTIDFHELGPRLLVLAVTNAQEQGWASHVCPVSRIRGGPH